MIEVTVLGEHDIPHIGYILLTILVGKLSTFLEHKRQFSLTIKLTIMVQVKNFESVIACLLGVELLVLQLILVLIFLLFQECICIEVLLGRDGEDT